MKKKKIIALASSALALLLIAVLVYQLAFKTNLEIHAAFNEEDYASASDADWQTVDSGSVELDNAALHFSLDAKTTHFTVTDKATGVAYTSVSETAAAAYDGDDAAALLSEVVVAYHNASFVESNLYSSKHCVDYELAEVKTNGTSVRVYYTMRQSKVKTFAPLAFRQDLYENQVLPALSKSYQRRMNLYYTLYESDASDEETAAMKSQYPALNDENLYIIRGDIDEAGYVEITKLLTTSGYTEEEYLEDAEELKLDVQAAGMSVGFTVPVEYTLTEDGFSAEILSDLLTSDSKEYTALTMDLLPYFGALGENDPGYIFVPDGCGGVIDLSEKVGKSYTKRIYGYDGTLYGERTAQLSQNTVLPVYGMNRENGGYLAAVEGAAESARIMANVFGGVNHASNVYARFLFTPNDSTSLGATSGITNYFLYADRTTLEHPKVQFFLLDKENATYVGMAKRYQKHLIDTGVLGERLTASDNLPFYMDFTGYFTTQASVVGISYTQVNELSTVEHIGDAVSKLGELGVDNITVRLRAFGNGGMTPALMDHFDLNKNVGTVDQLKSLAALVKEQGGTLYLEDNLGAVYKDSTFDAFMRQKHASRTVTKLTAINGTYSPVLSDTQSTFNKYYLLSPMYFNTLSKMYSESFMKQVGTSDGFGFSWAMFGSRLWSDFEATRFVDASMARDLAVEAVETAKETFGTVMSDGGNQYSIAVSDVLLNVPSTGSLYDTISYPVPFFQMVLHGYKDYASAPFNLAANARSNRLASIEGGANVYYSCYTEPDEVLKELTDRSIQYPTGITGIYETIAADYKEFNDNFAALRTQLIVNHERVGKNVYRTTYEDGTKILVNYTDLDFTVDGITVPANGYTIQ